MPKEKESKSFWDKTVDFFKSLGRIPLVIIGGALVVLVGVLAAVLGFGDKVNVGGILGKLMGSKGDEKDPIEVANEAPEDRKQDKGEADSEGFVQREVERLDKSNGVFRDQDIVKVKGEKGEEKIKLPDGVKDKDVKEVYEIQPGEFKVVTKSTPSNVTDEDIEKWKEKLK